jgi:hypothetical protein
VTSEGVSPRLLAFAEEKTIGVLSASMERFDQPQAVGSKVVGGVLDRGQLVVVVEGYLG